MTHERSEVAAAVDERTVRSISKLLLAALSVIALLYLASLLPGTHWLVPGTSITVAALVSAVATLAVVGLLLYLAPALAALVRTGLGGPERIVDDVAFAIQLLVVLSAVLIAHRGFAPAIVPLLYEFAWVYDVVFLVLAVPPLLVLAARLYVSLDPAADLIAERLVGADAESETDASDR